MLIYSRMNDVCANNSDGLTPDLVPACFCRRPITPSRLLACVQPIREQDFHNLNILRMLSNRRSRILSAFHLRK